MTVRAIAKTFSFLAAVCCAAAEAAPSMVANLYTGKAHLDVGTQPEYGSEIGGVAYFYAIDVAHGGELWRSDGSAAGTFRVTDVCPGECSSSVQLLGEFHGSIYLLASDGERGTGLWRTDGNSDREERVAGVCSSDACFEGLGAASTWRGAEWFLVPGADKQPTLWTSDLTPRGTRRLADLCDDLDICGFDVAYSSAGLFGPDPSGRGLLLSVYSGSTLSIYRTDGTLAGTELLHRIDYANAQSAAKAPTPERELRRTLGAATSAGEPFFFLDRNDLWVSDGTAAGTHFVRNLVDLLRYADYDYPQSTVVVDGVWYAIFGYGEWIRSDGTAQGTARIGEFVPAVYGATLVELGGQVLAVSSGGIVRAGVDAASTAKVVDWPPGEVLTVVPQGDRLWVLTSGSVSRLFTTDGTQAGTRRVRLPPGPPIDQDAIAKAGSGVIFTRGADDLWGADATGRVIARLHAFQPTDGPALAGSFAVGEVLRDRLLFFAATASGTKLYASDGTAAGTTVVSDRPDRFGYSSDYSAPSTLFVRAGARLVFSSDGSVFATDGTPDGTHNLRAGPLRPYSHGFAPIANLGDRLLFAGRGYALPRCDGGEEEPWVTDGTADRTTQVIDLNPYNYSGGGSICYQVPLSSSPGAGAALGAVALFPASDLVHGRELFASDGTAAGTRLVADIDPRTVPNEITDPPGIPPLAGLSSSPEDLVRVGSVVFFSADDGVTGRELWVSNGTRRGTRRVIDLVPGAAGSAPHDLVAFQERLAFVAAVGGRERLFSSDGTAAGTVEIATPAALQRANALTPVGQRLFFVGSTEATGAELWTLLGTGGAHAVTDLRPGARGSALRSLTAIGGMLVFSATDGVHGVEPWRSDGTAAGTWALGDVAPGEASSNPGAYRVANGRVLFSADDGVHGRELWALPLADLRTRE